MKKPLKIEPRIAKGVKERVGDYTKSRTRSEELTILKALGDSVENLKGKARADVLIETLKRHPWMGVYMRAALDPNRKYGLKSKHLKQLKRPMKSTIPFSFFVMLTKLQFKILPPMEAALEWWRILQEMPKELRPVANMILNKKFFGYTIEQANFCMKKAKIQPRINDGTNSTE